MMPGSRGNHSQSYGVAPFNMSNVVLRSVLKVGASDLNVCHINGGSLCGKAKIDQFRRIFEGSNAYVIVELGSRVILRMPPLVLKVTT